MCHHEQCDPEQVRAALFVTGASGRTDNHSVYAYTHRIIRELACCDRGQVEVSGGERLFTFPPCASAPQHRVILRRVPQLRGAIQRRVGQPRHVPTLRSKARAIAVKKL